VPRAASPVGIGRGHLDGGTTRGQLITGLGGISRGEEARCIQGAVNVFDGDGRDAEFVQKIKIGTRKIFRGCKMKAHGIGRDERVEGGIMLTLWYVTEREGEGEEGGRERREEEERERRG
jgi:hypothetical protein